jgi:hypothetical protein
LIPFFSFILIIIFIVLTLSLFENTSSLSFIFVNLVPRERVEVYLKKKMYIPIRHIPCSFIYEMFFVIQ